VWQQAGNHLVGSIGGHSGGGAFKFEKFVYHNGKISSSVENSLSDKYSRELVGLLEDCQDMIMELHQQDVWSSADNLLLNHQKSDNSQGKKHIRSRGESIPRCLEPVFEMLGLIFRPEPESFSDEPVDFQFLPSRIGGSGSELSGHTQYVYGNMKWFSVSEQPKEKDLPREFAEARKIWNTKSESGMGEAIALLEKYVGALFIPSNITNWEEIFEDPEGNGCPEYGAIKVKVVGLDFSRGPIPLCKAEAWFDVPVTALAREIDIQQWQEENDYIHSGLSFFWILPPNEATDDFDLTFSEHMGSEGSFSNDLGERLE
jgi:hypothetical protein